MDDSADESRQRRNRRRLESSRLSVLMRSFEAGEGGLEQLAKFLDANLILPDKLAAIDVAVRRRLIDRSELSAEPLAPSPQEFGLSSDIKPTIVPKRLREVLDNEKFALALLGSSCVVAFVYLWHAGAGWFLSAFLAFFIGPLGLLAVCVFCMALAAACNRFLPGAAGHRQFQRARKRHEVLQAARSILARANDIHSFYSASGPEFERLVARVFRRWGYQVRELGGANDGGIDLIVTLGSETALVQCKALGRPVSPAVVRELYGTLLHSDATHAYLATIRGASRSGIDWARGKPITFLIADDFILGAPPR